MYDREKLDRPSGSFLYTILLNERKWFSEIKCKKTHFKDDSLLKLITKLMYSFGKNIYIPVKQYIISNHIPDYLMTAFRNMCRSVSNWRRMSIKLSYLVYDSLSSKLSIGFSFYQSGGWRECPGLLKHFTNVEHSTYTQSCCSKRAFNNRRILFFF